MSENSNQIAHFEIGALTPWKRNARKHSKKQIRQIAESIKEFGFTNPVLIDQQQRILAGHGRVEAAKHLGLPQVPCLFIENLTEEQKRAYVLADNKLAINATWDDELLAEELKALADIDLNFDIETTGFSVAEIDTVILADEPEGKRDPKADILPTNILERVQFGDVWQLGSHRLICGDSLKPGTVARLMDGDKAQMVFTDRPYNVKVDGHIGGSGQTKHQEFAFASGEMSEDEFTAFLQKAIANLTTHALDGSIHFICMDWRHIEELMAAAKGQYAELKNLITWVKDNGGMGTFYRSRHELIFAYKFGTAPHIKSFELGQHGRYRTNVWEYRGATLEEQKMHPTVKPVQMIADAIKDVSGRQDIVLDLFGGSGSTLIAAEKTGRHARLCEYDPKYCDLILARFEAFAHEDVHLIYREGANHG